MSNLSDREVQSDCNDDHEEKEIECSNDQKWLLEQHDRFECVVDLKILYVLLNKVLRCNHDNGPSNGVKVGELELTRLLLHFER